jgi:hypothetical protein
MSPLAHIAGPSVGAEQGQRVAGNVPDALAEEMVVVRDEMRDECTGILEPVAQRGIRIEATSRR